MAKPFAWSYSALSAFETCPRQFHEMRILKRWPDPKGEAQQWGIEVHKHIEYRFKESKPLPDFLGHIEPMVALLEKSKGPVQPEYKLALNVNFQPTTFFSPSAWVRAVGDVVKIHEDRALLLDWKTGKRKEGDDQLKLQSAVTFATYPHLQTIKVIYAWIKDHSTTVRTYQRDEAPLIWQEFLPRVKRMEIALAGADCPPKPSGLCRQWCHVKSCEFNGKGAY